MLVGMLSALNIGPVRELVKWLVMGGGLKIVWAKLVAAIAMIPLPVAIAVGAVAALTAAFMATTDRGRKAFAAIKKAIKSGDIAGAIKILMATLYAEWVRGWNALEDTFATVWAGILDTLTTVLDAIVSNVQSTFGSLEKAINFVLEKFGRDPIDITATLTTFQEQITKQKGTDRSGPQQDHQRQRPRVERSGSRSRCSHSRDQRTQAGKERRCQD